MKFSMEVIPLKLTSTL